MGLENVPALRLSHLSEDERRAYAVRHYDAYWLSASTEKQIKHQKLIAGASAKAVVTAAETEPRDQNVIESYPPRSDSGPRAPWPVPQA